MATDAPAGVMPQPLNNMPSFGINPGRMRTLGLLTSSRGFRAGSDCAAGEKYGKAASAKRADHCHFVSTVLLDFIKFGQRKGSLRIALQLCVAGYQPVKLRVADSRKSAARRWA
jgi:hypothetical protein